MTFNNVLEWLERNAFWNSDILKVGRSTKTSGIGVFLEGESEDDDNLLLRIPKANILSSKNSFICNLLDDFNSQYSNNPEVNLTKGMHSVVISFIYELSAGEKSPWYDYISTIDPKDEQEDLSNIPICLWTEEEKLMLKNTECDLLGMLSSSELIQFYIECIRFAHINAKYVDVPDVFIVELPEDDADQESFLIKNHFKKVSLFAKYVQTVISRAFGVDEYHGLSLVPGADLFNHIAPALIESNGSSKVQGRENVHFICDGEDACAVCGEINCENHEEELEDELNDEMIDEEVEGEEIEEEYDEDEAEHSDNHEDHDTDNGYNIESSSDSDDTDGDNKESDEENNAEETELSETEEIPDIPEITMEYIKEMELEIENDEASEAETARSEEEVSTLSLSEDETTEPLEDAPKQIGHSLSEEEELALQLSDSSQCCDIVLTSQPTRDYNFELFNTYGNTLSNAYLLQRYGFVNDFKEPNVNNSCLLSVQMFAYIKKFKKDNSGIKGKQLATKLDWYENVGFEIVNDLASEYASNCHDGKKDDHHDHHDHHDGCCDDEQEDISDTLPETWQLSPVVRYDGSISPQTYALLKIILMPSKIFQAKLVNCKSQRKLSKRVFRLLLPFEDNSYHSEIHQIIKTWCKNRLSRYNDYESMKATTGARQKIIRDLIKQEGSILKNAIDKL